MVHEMATTDVFVGKQASRRKASCMIIVNGDDVTSRIEPHLISLTVSNNEGHYVGTDTCALELDDRDASLAIPPDNAPVQVWLGWHTERMHEVFNGWVKDAESGFGRKHGGRRLWIDAMGMDLSGQGASPVQRHLGEGAPPGQAMGTLIPVSEALKAAAATAGVTMHVGAAFDDVKRDYWSQGESFHHFGARLAEELGAIFKVEGGRASFTPATQAINANGDDLGFVTVTWGDNLIEWHIKPFAGRPQAAAVVTRYYDVQQSIWNVLKKAIGGDVPFGRAKRVRAMPAPAPNEQVGNQLNEGQESSITRRRGIGWVLFNGEPNAIAGKSLVLQGARPGVNGTYRMKVVEHRYSRAGFFTRAEIDHPVLTSGDFDGWLPGRGPPKPPAPP